MHNVVDDEVHKMCASSTMHGDEQGFNFFEQLLNFRASCASGISFTQAFC